MRNNGVGIRLGLLFILGWMSGLETYALLVRLVNESPKPASLWILVPELLFCLMVSIGIMASLLPPKGSSDG